MPHLLQRTLAATLCLGTLGATLPARARDDDPWLARDKALHASLSLAMGAAGYGASVPWLSHRAKRAATGFGLSMSVGIAKELYDLGGRGDPSVRDLTWDLVGALTGVGLASLLDWALSRRRPHGPVDAGRQGATMRLMAPRFTERI